MTWLLFADLVARVGFVNATRYLDDNCDGQPDTLDQQGAATAGSPVATVLEEADGHATGLLLRSFPGLAVESLAADPLFKSSLADIALGLAAQRKQEWMHPVTGKYPNDERMKRGVENFKAIATGYPLRLGAERTGAKNRIFAGEVAPPAPATHEFAPTRRNPFGDGDF